MKKDILVPAAGESVKEADLVTWYKKTGEILTKENFGEALKDLIMNPENYSVDVQDLRQVYLHYYHNNDNNHLP